MAVVLMTVILMEEQTMKLFGGNKYRDEELVNHAMVAIADDPMIHDHGSVVVTSKNGVITISGLARSSQEKDRIEGVVQSAVTNMGLKFDHIVNELKAPQPA
jgi:hypothetical protein